MNEIITAKVADKKRAIIKVEEKLSTLKRSLEAKQFAVAQMQAKQDSQWDALKKMEKIEREVVKRTERLEELRGQMAEMNAKDIVPEGVSPRDHIWAYLTEEYRGLQAELDLLMKANEDALGDINRIYYGKDMNAGFLDGRS